MVIIVNQVMKSDAVLRQRREIFCLAQIHLAAEKERQIHPDDVELQISFIITQLSVRRAKIMSHRRCESFPVRTNQPPVASLGIVMVT
jgi:hypothetical protein